MQLRLKKIIKLALLKIREIFFRLISCFTLFMRKKTLDKNKINKILVITLNRVGDAIVSLPTFRAIKENLPHSQLTVFANSYVKDILDRINYIDNLVTYDKGLSFFQRARLVRKLSRNQYDLAVDLTCDYTVDGALLSYLSGATYRVGYNSYGRGFLFNRAVKNEKEPLHIVDELLNIIKSISLDTKDKILKISPSKEAKETIRKFLRERNVKDEDLLIGIHPGSNYPTQSWLKERFAEVADKVTEKYKARVVLIGGQKEKELIIRITKDMINRPLIFFNRPIRELLALIQLCHLLICNNSGPLHLATALRTPTVSTMGPTIPERWWPYGQGHVVIRRDLSCMPCNDATCKLKTFDCMRLITVEEVLEATEQQIFSTTATRES